MKKYIVETISQHLVRYLIEAREEEHALDEVTVNSEIYCETFKEFSQKHLGDVILQAREVTDDEIVKLFDKENYYLAESWTREQKINALSNKIKYDNSESIPDERDWEYDGLGNKVYKGSMRAYKK